MVDHGILSQLWAWRESLKEEEEEGVFEDCVLVSQKCQLRRRRCWRCQCQYLRRRRRRRRVGNVWFVVGQLCSLLVSAICLCSGILFFC